MLKQQWIWTMVIAAATILIAAGGLYHRMNNLNTNVDKQAAVLSEQVNHVADLEEKLEEKVDNLDAKTDEYAVAIAEIRADLYWIKQDLRYVRLVLEERYAAAFWPTPPWGE